MIKSKEHANSSKQSTRQSSFHERLRVLIAERGGNATAFARLAGISQSGLHRIISGGDPSFQILIQIANAAGVSLDWLATGVGEMRQPSSTGALDRQGASDDFALVPLYDIHVSAGTGTEVLDEVPLKAIAFGKDWLGRHAAGGIDKLAAMHVQGDSMRPDLEPGDLILIDRAIDVVRGDGIYVINLYGDLMVKRLQKAGKSQVLVRSSNPAYDPLTINTDNDAELHVVGRVIWFGREL